MYMYFARKGEGGGRGFFFHGTSSIAAPRPTGGKKGSLFPSPISLCMQLREKVLQWEEEEEGELTFFGEGEICAGGCGGNGRSVGACGRAPLVYYA